MSWRLLRTGLLSGLAAVYCGIAVPAFAGEENGEEMFSISVDGEHVAGTAPKGGEPAKAPGELGTADIQVKYDGLGGKPILNAATTDSRRSFAVRTSRHQLRCRVQQPQQWRRKHVPQHSGAHSA